MTTRILLAEDNEQLVRLLTTFLENQGHAVTTAKTGSEALQAIAAGGIDVLLLDLKLPETSGVEVLQRLRKSPQWASLPVIIMSGVYRGAQYAAAAQKLGVRHYLEKPFTRQAFLDAIRATVATLPDKAPVRRLRELIIGLYNNRKSGMLTLSPGFQVAFLNGEPFSFLAGGKDEFAAFLLSQRKITSDDLRQFAGNGGERLRLVQSGLLTYEELMEASRLFLTKKLIDSLELTGATTFSEGACQAELPLVPISIPRLLYQSAWDNAGQLDLQGFLDRYGALYPRRTRLYYRRANLTTMRRGDIDLLEGLTSWRSIQDSIAAAENGNEAAAFLQFLLTLGMVTLHETPTPDETPDFPQKCLFNRPLEEAATVEEEAVGFEDLVEELSGSVELVVGTEGMGAPLSSSEIDFEQSVQRDHGSLQDKNYYEIFDLSQSSFSFNALKDAYFAKTRQYSPEKFMELSGTTQNMAQEILSHYANAYNTLSNVVAKERYDEMLNANTIGLDGKKEDSLQARIQFQSGKVFLEMGEFDNAEKSLQDAYTIEPDNALHCAFLAWATYRNPANKNSRGAHEKARTLLAKSLQIDRSAEAHSFRGWMLLDEGRDGLAESEFLRALKLNPKERYADKGMRQILEKREGAKKGLFQRMFS
jgi:CheY-like chemotaxis protein/tetratricopeptide (TPR) repeat protein